MAAPEHIISTTPLRWEGDNIVVFYPSEQDAARIAFLKHVLGHDYPPRNRIFFYIYPGCEAGSSPQFCLQMNYMYDFGDCFTIPWLPHLSLKSNFYAYFGIRSPDERTAYNYSLAERASYFNSHISYSGDNTLRLDGLGLKCVYTLVSNPQTMNLAVYNEVCKTTGKNTTITFGADGMPVSSAVITNDRRISGMYTVVLDHCGGRLNCSFDVQSVDGSKILAFKSFTAPIDDTKIVPLYESCVIENTYGRYPIASSYLVSHEIYTYDADGQMTTIVPVKPEVRFIMRNGQLEQIDYGEYKRLFC